MASDNVQASKGTLDGSFFRTLSDGTNEWPASVLAYPTTISPGANVFQLIDGTHGLPVAGVGTFTVSLSGTGAVNVAQYNGSAVGAGNAIHVQPGTGATFPISVASLPLPSGAATAAKQPALGTAGTASSDVLTVQGIASMTPLKVDGSGVTQPVSGTFWQATQPISGTVTVTQGTAANLKVDLSGTAANATAIKVDGSGVTQPVSGTFWQATQPISGTVSTNADAGVIAGVAPSKSFVIAGQYNTSAPTLTNTQTVALQTDVNGLLKVNVAAGGGSGGTSSSFGSAFPATGTAVGASDGTNMKALLVDASGFLKVNVAAGSGGNGAASATGSAVPASADYLGVNVGGNLQGAVGFDLDTGAGTEYNLGISLRQSASGGSVEVGTDSHPLRTDPTGTTTQPVSGTVTVTQSTASNLKVDLSGTAANATAIKVDGSAVTQPISAASLPLPTGAATAAKQPALGTAGSASSDVITVQGIASMTALKVDLASTGANSTAINVTDPDATASGNLTSASGGGSTVAISTSGRATIGIKITGTWSATLVFEASVDGTNWDAINVFAIDASATIANASANGVWFAPVSGFSQFRVRCSAYTSGTAAVSLDASLGGQYVSMISPLPTGSNTIGAVTQASGPWTNNLTQLAGTAVDVNSGTKSAGTLRVVLATDQPALTNKLLVTPDANSSVNLNQAGGNAINTGTGNTGTGTLRVVLATDQPQLTNKLLVTPDANSAVNVAQFGGSAAVTGTGAGGAGIPRVTVSNDSSIRVYDGTNTAAVTANTTNNGLVVQDQPATAGGLSFTHVTSAASNNLTQAKGTAGQLYTIAATNTNASVRYLKVFNKASASVTMGTTNADFQFAIPGNASGAGLVLNIDKGIAMGTGITIAITGGVALNDNTSISANDVCLTIGYK